LANGPSRAGNKIVDARRSSTHSDSSYGCSHWVRDRVTRDFLQKKLLRNSDSIFKSARICKLFLKARAGAIQHRPRFERPICEVLHSYTEKVMEPSRLKVNGESVDASCDAERRMASLWTDNNGLRRRFVTALSANLVKVLEEEHEELLGARWQRGHQRRPTNTGRVLTEALDVGTNRLIGRYEG